MICLFQKILKMCRELFVALLSIVTLLKLSVKLFVIPRNFYQSTFKVIVVGQKVLIEISVNIFTPTAFFHGELAN